MTRIIRREVRKRGFFGKVFKWTFVLFNLLMLWWLIAALVAVTPQVHEATSDAARTGAQVGALIGVSLVAMIWLAGAVVLGLFTMMTRGSVTIIEERQE